MNGRSLLWTTLIGAVATMIIRRLFNRFARRKNRVHWTQFTQPVMQMVRRAVR